MSGGPLCQLLALCPEQLESCSESPSLCVYLEVFSIFSLLWVLKKDTWLFGVRFPPPQKKMASVIETSTQEIGTTYEGLASDPGKQEGGALWCVCNWSWAVKSWMEMPRVLCLTERLGWHTPQHLR